MYRYRYRYRHARQSDTPHAFKRRWAEGLLDNDNAEDLIDGIESYVPDFFDRVYGNGGRELWEEFLGEE